MAGRSGARALSCRCGQRGAHATRGGFDSQRSRARLYTTRGPVVACVWQRARRRRQTELGASARLSQSVQRTERSRRVYACAEVRSRRGSIWLCRAWRARACVCVHVAVLASVNLASSFFFPVFFSVTVCCLFRARLQFSISVEGAAARTCTWQT